jgi:hypothetical protein
MADAAEEIGRRAKIALFVVGTPSWHQGDSPEVPARRNSTRTVPERHISALCALGLPTWPRQQVGSLSAANATIDE